MATFNPLSTQIKWVNGMPMIVEREIIHTKQSMKEMARVAVSLPYEPHPDPETGCTSESEARFEGLTNGEVMLIKLAENAAKGDFEATKDLLDRICGKATQSVESTNMNMTFQDYLQTLPDPTEQMQNITKEQYLLLNTNMEDASAAMKLEVKLLKNDHYMQMADDL